MHSKLSRRRMLAFTAIIWLGAHACVTTDKIAVRGPVEPAAERDVRKTVDLFNRIVKEDLDIKLLKPVPVYVTADTAIYRRVLASEFKLSKDELPKWSDSTGFSTSEGVAMDASKSLMNNAKDRCCVTAHELFHQLQYSVTGGHRSENPRYFQEGTADLIGARVAEKLGFTEVKYWRKEVVNEVRATPRPATVRELLAADESDAWHKLIDDGKHPYGMSSLMALSLFDLSPNNVYKGIADYNIEIGCGKNIEAAFSKAFGISYQKFLRDFETWYADVVSKPAELEIVPDQKVPPSVLAEIKDVFKNTQLFFKENWGEPMKMSPRIILVSDAAGAVSFLTKEFGLEASEASDLFGGDSSVQSYWNGGTAVINLRNATVKESPTLAGATVFSRMYQQEIAPQTGDEEGLYWLYIGGSDLTAALIAEKSGKKPVAESKKSWLESVRKAASQPSLNRLQTRDEWRKACEKYGGSDMYAFARLAALLLTDQSGQKALADWHRALREKQEARKAFEKIFGISLNRFEQDFESYLKEQIK